VLTLGIIILSSSEKSRHHAMLAATQHVSPRQSERLIHDTHIPVEHMAVYMPYVSKREILCENAWFSSCGPRLYRDFNMCYNVLHLDRKFGTVMLANAVQMQCRTQDFLVSGLNILAG
jgi:hypothetical protein